MAAHNRYQGRDRLEGDGQLLSEINAALAWPAPGRLTRELERQHELRQGPARRLRLARVLRLMAIGVLAAIGLDLANGPAHLAAFAACRTCIALPCGIAAWLLPRTAKLWTEHLLYGVPLLGAVIGTEVMGKWAAGHYADRYMMAAVVIALLGLAIPPVRLGTSRLVALAAALLFPVVLALVPGNLPFWDNWDILAFAWGMLATAALIARLNVDHARIAFLHQLRHELVAAEMGLLNAELLRLSGTDALTGLPNRRAFDERMQQLWADRRVAGFGLAMIDVDRFKAFNDTAGHTAGDACLRSVARLISGALRGADWAARYGGEEFAVLWVCGANDLAAMGERLRCAVEAAAMPHPGLEGAAVTISVGLSWQQGAGRDRGTPSDLMTSADSALYEAKRAGRNRIAIAGTVLHGPSGGHETPTNIRC